MAKPKPKKKIVSNGSVRRKHEDCKPGARKGLSTKQRVDLVNAAFEKALADAECEQLDVICEVALHWAAELNVVHHPEITDDQIDQATIMYPDEALTRIIHSVAILSGNNQHLTPDAIADFVADRLSGKTTLEQAIRSSSPQTIN